MPPQAQRHLVPVDDQPRGDGSGSAGVIKVDRGIPMPPKKTNARYPWAEMQVGESFFADKPPNKIAGSIWHQRVYHGRYYETRSVTEDGVEGCRVWRIR